ncbi:MAG: hypothetical protein ACR2IE_09260 [Candidatus Sumerlaeaceae bacterium]
MAKPKKQLDDLKSALGDQMTPAERAYLEKLESGLKAQPNYDDPEEVEAEIRRRERERIAKNFKPRAPLYRPAEGRETQDLKPRRDDKQSYQDDPRYREYYERLRKTREASGDAGADDDLQPMTMDELEKRGYDAVASSKGPKGRRPITQVTTNIQPGRTAPGPPSKSSADYVSGTILRLDDGSVAIYKDAVSGKDYALLYFLEPDGTVAPRGIFLQQYDSQHIGHLPEPLFAQMRESGSWDRDAVIFHLERYEFASVVRQVASHQEGRMPGRTSGAAISEAHPSEPSLAAETADTPADIEVAPEPAKPRDMLERGRVLRINVGGKVWESVYWASDEMGPIVAHDTHKEWSLMHLDLGRFKDSVEYGELMTGNQLQEIETSLLRQK